MQAGLKLLVYLGALVVTVHLAEAKNILVVMPIPSRSHHMAISAVSKVLADNGHNVTYFTGLDESNTINPTHNHRLIHLGNPRAGNPDEDKASRILWERERNSIGKLMHLMARGTQIVNWTLSNPVFREEISKPGLHFDLILLEAFFFQEGFLGLAHQFNAPVVVVNPFGAWQRLNDVMGNPVNPAWVPSPFLGYSDRMSFAERAVNAMLYVVNQALYRFHYIPQQQALMEAFWPSIPPLESLLHSKVALTLVNNHFTLAYPVPMAPNVVEIGGIQIPERVRPLPKDLQTYLDSSVDGVVYFSMGSNLKVEHAPADKTAAILGALGKLKEKVLLKWDGPVPPNIASNIRAIEWAPQSDVLAHPNIRLFVTHGGVHSTQESVHHGVPIVGIPMFGDQRFNMHTTQHKGIGITVDFGTMTESVLLEAMKEVLGNPKYKHAADTLSALFRSSPMRPAEAALFAVETVLAHGGDHARPACVGMPLYQLLLLDVILVALLPVLGVLLCCRLACRRGAEKRKKD